MSAAKVILIRGSLGGNRFSCPIAKQKHHQDGESHDEAKKAILCQHNLRGLAKNNVPRSTLLSHHALPTQQP